MKIIKAIILGILGGLLYATVSFVLISPYLRGNFVAILSWGFQGLLFSICYLLFSFLFVKSGSANIPRKSAIIGGVGGLLSCSHNLIITMLNFFEGASRPEVHVPPELIQGLFTQLAYYSVGCIALGSVVGYFIGYKATLGVQTT
jgi:hypothetical protein